MQKGNTNLSGVAWLLFLHTLSSNCWWNNRNSLFHGQVVTRKSQRRLLHQSKFSDPVKVSRSETHQEPKSDLEVPRYYQELMEQMSALREYKNAKTRKLDCLFWPFTSREGSLIPQVPLGKDSRSSLSWTRKKFIFRSFLLMILDTYSVLPENKRSINYQERWNIGD